MATDIMNTQKSYGSVYSPTMPLYDINRAFENARYLKYYGPSTDEDHLETHTRISRYHRRKSMHVMEQDPTFKFMFVADEVNDMATTGVDLWAWFKRHSVKVYPTNELVSKQDRSEEDLTTIAAYFCVESDETARQRKISERAVSDARKVRRGATCKISPEVHNIRDESLDISKDRLRRVVAMFCVEKPGMRNVADPRAEECNQSQARSGLSASIKDQEVMNKKKQNVVLKFLRDLKKTFLGQ